MGLFHTRVCVEELFIGTELENCLLLPLSDKQHQYDKCHWAHFSISGVSGYLQFSTYFLE
jgi:hypothetical protein